MSAPDSLTSLLAYVRLLMRPESNRYAVEPPPEHRRGYWEALCDVEDAIEAALAESPAAPLVSPPGERTPPTCATCQWFKSTANKAKYPKANAGECRHNALKIEDEHDVWPLGVWESFGCTLHEPVEARPSAPPPAETAHDTNL